MLDFYAVIYLQQPLKTMRYIIRFLKFRIINRIVMDGNWNPEIERKKNRKTWAIMPVGRCLRRTADSRLLRCWPPGPEDLNVLSSHWLVNCSSDNPRNSLLPLPLLFSMLNDILQLIPNFLLVVATVVKPGLKLGTLRNNLQRDWEVIAGMGYSTFLYHQREGLTAKQNASPGSSKQRKTCKLYKRNSATD